MPNKSEFEFQVSFSIKIKAETLEEAFNLVGNMNIPNYEPYQYIQDTFSAILLGEEDAD